MMYFVFRAADDSAARSAADIFHGLREDDLGVTQDCVATRLDPFDLMLELDHLLAGRPYDEIKADPLANGDVAEGVYSTTTAVWDGLSNLSDDDVETMAEEWSTAESLGDEGAQLLLLDLKDLAVVASKSSERLYLAMPI
jgi:hypothetical protein